MRIEVSVAYEVEFDTETGTAEVLGHGRVESFPETVRRRTLQSHFEPDEEDAQVLTKLIDDGLVQAPRPGETIMLSDEEKALDPESYKDCFDDEGELAENLTKGEAVVDSLVGQESFARLGRRRRKRRR